MRRALAGLTLWAALALGCAPTLAARAAGSDAEAFDGERAFAHLVELAAIGPRTAGTPGGDAARAYVRRELEGMGYTVEEEPLPLAEVEGEETPALANLRAVGWGDSDDVIVLAAPIDTPEAESFHFVGANEGASGAALLLELARVLRERPLPYTVWFTFMDGEHLGGRYLGSRAFARQLANSGQLARLRLLVYFHQVADRDLAIARDARSHRGTRRIFFEAARRLGHADAFPEGATRAVPFSGHLALERAGFRRVLLIMDDRYGGDEAPGVYHRTAEDTPERCAPESLAVVGRVTLEGLRDAAKLFETVDSRARVREQPSATDAPEAHEDEGTDPLGGGEPARESQRDEAPGADPGSARPERAEPEPGGEL